MKVEITGFEFIENGNSGVGITTFDDGVDHVLEMGGKWGGVKKCPGAAWQLPARGVRCLPLGQSCSALGGFAAALARNEGGFFRLSRLKGDG